MSKRSRGKKSKQEEDVEPPKLRQKTESLLESFPLITTLITTRAEDFMWEQNKDKPLYIAKRDDLVADVWRGMIARNFVAVPVLSHDGQSYYGFLDVLDIVKYAIEHFGGLNKFGEEKSFWDLVKEERLFQTKKVKDLMTYPLSRRNPFHPVYSGYSLWSVVEALAREPGLHRIPIVDRSSLTLLNMITQSQLIEWLYSNLEQLGEKGNRKVSECPDFYRPVVCVSETEVTINAFNVMVNKGVSAVAVVDDSGKLKGNLSVNDIKVMSPSAGLFWRLSQTIKNFIVKLKKDYKEMHNRPRTLVVAKGSDTLKQVMEKLATKHVHRLYIVDGDKKPIGVVSLKDILLECISIPKRPLPAKPSIPQEAVDLEEEAEEKAEEKAPRGAPAPVAPPVSREAPSAPVVSEQREPVKQEPPKEAQRPEPGSVSVGREQVQPQEALPVKEMPKPDAVLADRESSVTVVPVTVDPSERDLGREIPIK